jgi:fermentation-respiration switch protein FrsA (DUF1100 family)
MLEMPQPSKWRRWVVLPTLLAVLVYLLATVVDSMTFHPAAYPEGYWEWAEALNAEDVSLTTSDGVELHAWFIAAKTDQPLARTLYLHGNAGNITHRPDHIEAITRAGSDILIVDYRGYGKSGGSPSEQGLYLDGLAAFDWLASRTGEDRPIVCQGESLGTAVATEVAVQRRCSGLILEAPFPSRAAVAAQLVPVIGPILARGFETAQKISGIACPLLVVHGTADRVISQQFGREVFEAAESPKEFWSVPGAGHNDIVDSAGEEYVHRLAEFYLRLR